MQFCNELVAVNEVVSTFEMYMLPVLIANCIGRHAARQMAFQSPLLLQACRALILLPACQSDSVAARPKSKQATFAL